MIGSESGHAAGGALIDDATGALAGGLVGNAADAREERDGAIAQAQYAEARSQIVSRALAASDVAEMTRQGVGDDVIVNALNVRGCRFDGTPQSIIHLKQQGISDRVLSAMQTTAIRSADAVPVMAAPPPVVYTAPPPPPGVVIYGGPRPYWGPGPYGPYWGPRGYWGYRW